jgi:CRISPR-associated protein Cmx8
MEKRGNSIKMLSFERLTERPGLISGYERIKTTFRNPLFRAAVLRSLLRDQPWYSEMLVHFAERPWPFFIESEDTPRFLPRFASDARAKFRSIYKDSHDMTTEDFTAEQKEPDRLALIVRRLVNRYVEGRAEAKTGLKVKDFPKEKIKDGERERRIYPETFREAQQRVCSDAFLAMRSRHDSDFVEYFVGSVCSVSQYLPPEDYQFLTTILLRRNPTTPVGALPLSWEDVKALAMMAISAHSYAIQPREAAQTN